MSGQIIGPIGVLPTGGASIPLALDMTPGSGAGFLNTNATASSVTSATFTTGAVNEIIVVAVTTQANSPQGNGAVTSVTGTGLTFARVPGLTAPVIGANTLDMWWALATGIFSNTITVNVNTVSFTTSAIFAVVGANLVTPWDASGPTTSATSTVAHITSTSTNAFGIGAVVNGGIAGPNAGWTTLTTASFCCVVTKIRTASAFSNEAFDSADDGTAGASIAIALRGS